MDLSIDRAAPLIYGACFHAQQCAEKYLKAILIVHDLNFPKVHDLVALRDVCSQAGIAISVSEDELSTLSFYAVQVRYPSEDPTVDEAREAVAIARSLRKFARGQLGLSE
jgi:HEPN domain-containing protein